MRIRNYITFLDLQIDRNISTWLTVGKKDLKREEHMEKEMLHFRIG